MLPEAKAKLTLQISSFCAFICCDCPAKAQFANVTGCAVPPVGYVPFDATMEVEPVMSVDQSVAAEEPVPSEAVYENEPVPGPFEDTIMSG